MSDNKKIDYIQHKLDSVEETCASIDKQVALQKAAFDQHTLQDERMYEELKRMNDILQANTDSLREHMHRSDLLEDLVKKMDKRFSPMEIEFQRKEAVRQWVTSKAKFIGKIGAAVAALTTLWMLIQPLLSHLLH
jgi:hypothetical protein